MIEQWELARRISIFITRGVKWDGVQQTQTADLQMYEVNIVVKCSNRFPIPKLDFQKTWKFRDRESVKAFHNNVYLVHLQVCSLHLSHTEKKFTVLRQKVLYDALCNFRLTLSMIDLYRKMRHRCVCVLWILLICNLVQNRSLRWSCPWDRHVRRLSVRDDPRATSRKTAPFFSYE